jgi:23S rRNA (guanosine2251-2'-O)-methyltransferase
MPPGKAVENPHDRPPGKAVEDPNDRPPGKPPGKPSGRRAAGPLRERGEGWIYGHHAVAAALANPQRRWRRLAVLAAHREEAAALLAAARAEQRGTRLAPEDESTDAIAVMDRAAFDNLLPEGAVHQGWALQVEPLDLPDLDDVLRAAAVNPGRSVVVMLDQVGDPHNVGAVLRSAAAFGAAAVIVAEHGAPPATATLAKAASGGLDIVPLVRVVNLAQALDRLKDAGYWSCGLNEGAPAALAALDLGPRVVLVLGSEGGGLRRLIRAHCDYLARLPTRPEMPSLNVSNAAAIALYELVRPEAAGPGAQAD